MKNLNKICFCFLMVISFLTSSLKSDETKNLMDPHQYNFFTGMFDFSDDGKKSSLVGIQHQNENLFKDTFIGTISPVTGFLITGDTATYLYTGVQAEYNLGKINFTPSFTPGLYGQGDGKDLGHLVEFKSELQLSLDLFKDSKLGFSYNHISNADIGNTNPGSDNFLVGFRYKTN